MFGGLARQLCSWAVGKFNGQIACAFSQKLSSSAKPASLGPMVRLPSCDDVDHEAFAFALGLKLRSPMKRAPSKPRLSNFLQSSLQPTPIGSPEKENVATTMRPLSAPTLASAAKLSSASQSSIKIPCSGVSGVSHSQWGPIAKRPNACTIQRVVELHATWRRSCYDRPSAKMKGFMHVQRAHYPGGERIALTILVVSASHSLPGW